MVDEQVTEETDPDIKGEEYLWVYYDRQENWKEVEDEDNQYRGKVHALRWKFYMKDKEEYINIIVLVEVTHSKGGKLFGII